MKSDNFLLSIVVVTYNAEAPLADTLSSIAAQPSSVRDTVEFVLVDGASKDGTFELARKSGLFDILISEADDGIYDAMNKGTNIAHGRWIQFLNAGDRFSAASSLEKIVSALVPVRGSVWAIAGARHFGGDLDSLSPVLIRNVPHNWLRHATGLQPHCHQACWFSRDVLIQSGGHSLAFGTAGDFDVVLRFGLMSPPVVIETVAIDYLGGGVSDRSPLHTAKLLGASRSARMQLNSVGRAANTGLTVVALVLNWARIFLGATRRKIRSRNARGHRRD